jgi:prepilin-type N-terminal cleavage/methylation domain-containing protein
VIVRFFFAPMQPTPRRIHGYTLVEVLIVVVIVSVLATLSAPLFSFLRAKAGHATCISHLRIMGVGFNTYLQDHNNIWPQVPENLLEDEEQEGKWWWNALKDHGVAESHWACPSDRATKMKTEDKEKHFVTSYLVTQFDEFPGTAFRWQQPWVMETGSYHGSGKGPNMLMPDGSIQQGAVYLGPP